LVNYERAVRFEEVDAAGIVYFAHIVSYAHEAMENLFGALDGGYAGLIMRRRTGLPAVRLVAEFHAPLRYGDRMRIETEVTRLGNRSVTFSHRIRGGGGAVCAAISHTVVITDLDTLRSCAMPADIRALLEQHGAPVS
jgi:4-hydroxybenzoyl-CoA thioesterase